jgi:SM-20-related protein
MSLVNLNALRNAPLQSEPFEYFIASDVVDPATIDTVLNDYPKVKKGGSFPLSSTHGGPLFKQLCAELQGDAVRKIFAERFRMDLSERPTTLTVRGRCRMKDGQIHTDSKTKLITVLLYLNEPWNADGGRLKLLRNGESLDSAFAEVSPQFGTVVAFKNGPTAWHGHAPFEGVRRALQLNYVVDEAAVRRSERRHGLSALVKRLNPFAKAA